MVPQAFLVCQLLATLVALTTELCFCWSDAWCFIRQFLRVIAFHIRHHDPACADRQWGFLAEPTSAVCPASLVLQCYLTVLFTLLLCAFKSSHWGDSSPHQCIAMVWKWLAVFHGSLHSWPCWLLLFLDHSLSYWRWDNVGKPRVAATLVYTTLRVKPCFSILSCQNALLVYKNHLVDTLPKKGLLPSMSALQGFLIDSSQCHLENQESKIS